MRQRSGLGTWTSGVEPEERGPGSLALASEAIGAGNFVDVVKAPSDLRRYMRAVGMGADPRVEGEGLIRTVVGQREAVHQGRLLLDDLADVRVEWFRAAEVEHIEKGTIQSGFAPGWHVIPGGLRRRIPGVGDLTPGLRCFKDYLLRAGRAAALLSGASYPRHTNRGWPTYGTSDAELLLHVAASMLVERYDDVAEVGVMMADALGDHTASALPPHSVMWSRTGPSKKFIPVWTERSGELVQTGLVKGFYPRRRHVFGMPTFVNAAFRLEVIREKHLLRSTPVFGHSDRRTTEAQIGAARARGLRIISDDVKSFDQSIDATHQEALAREVHEHLFVEKGLVEVYRRAAVEMGVLAPPIRSGMEAMLYHKDGMEPSGHGGTSWDDSGINFARVLCSMAAAMRWSGPERALQGLLSDEWRLWIWGDDTLLAVPSGFDEDAYTAESLRLGYTCAMSTAPVFLMVCYPPGGGAWNLLSRSYVQSVWRERPSVRESIALFGLWNRWHLTTGHPMRMRGWRAITAAAAPDGVLERRRIRTPDDLDKLIVDAGFKAELQNDLRASPTALKDLIGSLSRGSGDLHDTPEGQYALALFGQELVRESEWRPPGRVGLRGGDRYEARELTKRAIEVMLGVRSKLGVDDTSGGGDSEDPHFEEEDRE